MISKTDLLFLLTKLQDDGIDVDLQIKKLMSNSALSIDVLKYINQNRQLDVAGFYELLRINHNKNKSKLYINIVKEIEQPEEVLTTLSALLNQILLYSRKLENKQLFLKHSRAEDIIKVLDNYFKTYDITNAINLLKFYKSDIKAFESMK